MLTGLAIRQVSSKGKELQHAKFWGLQSRKEYPFNRFLSLQRHLPVVDLKSN
jgi:hypothetical protein